MNLLTWQGKIRWKALLGFFGGIFTSSVFASPSGYVLNVELSPAICKIDATQKRLRQCLEGYSLVVSGLYPINPKKACESSLGLVLTPVQKRVIMRIMPDENVQMQLWRNVGGCVSMNANQYFRLMVNYSERLKIAEEFSTPTNLRVSGEWLEKRFLQQNVGMSANSFQFQCGRLDRNTSVLTNIKVCYSNTGRYISCETPATDKCPAHFLIQGSY